MSIIVIWTKHGRKIRRELQNYIRQRRGPRNLKPKSPEDCPLCNRNICFLPHRPKPEVMPWFERKSPRVRPKLVNTGGHACLNLLCDYFAVADPEIHALVSNGRRGQHRILYLKCQACGGCRTSRYGTPLYSLKTPLSRIAMVMRAMSAVIFMGMYNRLNYGLGRGHCCTTIESTVRELKSVTHFIRQHINSTASFTVSIGLKIYWSRLPVGDLDSATKND